MSEQLTYKRLEEIDAELQNVPGTFHLWLPVAELRAMVKEIQEVRDLFKSMSRSAHRAIAEMMSKEAT